MIQIHLATSSCTEKILLTRGRRYSSALLWNYGRGDPEPNSPPGEPWNPRPARFPWRFTEAEFRATLNGAGRSICSKGSRTAEGGAGVRASGRLRAATKRAPDIRRVGPGAVGQTSPLFRSRISSSDRGVRMAQFGPERKLVVPMGLDILPDRPLLCLECAQIIDPPQEFCPACRAEQPALVINAQAQCVRGSNE